MACAGARGERHNGVPEAKGLVVPNLGYNPFANR
ncbi:MAG: hypothetical protein E5299_01211 [Burkholderia gladioli]|nr:MAG: hypothetical protein E5299_01211 [Burkholderia gladioli]